MFQECVSFVVFRIDCWTLQYEVRGGVMGFIFIGVDSPSVDRFNLKMDYYYAVITLVFKTKFIW